MEEGESSRELFETARVNAVFFCISGFWVGFCASARVGQFFAVPVFALFVFVCVCVCFPFVLFSRNSTVCQASTVSLLADLCIILPFSLCFWCFMRIPLSGVIRANQFAQFARIG